MLCQICGDFSSSTRFIWIPGTNELNGIRMCSECVEEVRVDFEVIRKLQQVKEW